MAVYGYCRVSTARQASEGESLDVQRRQIEVTAHMHGLTLVDTAVEEGVSDASGTPLAMQPSTIAVPCSRGYVGAGRDDLVRCRRTFWSLTARRDGFLIVAKRLPLSRLREGRQNESGGLRRQGGLLSRRQLQPRLHEYVLFVAVTTSETPTCRTRIEWRSRPSPIALPARKCATVSWSGPNIPEALAAVGAKLGAALDRDEALPRRSPVGRFLPFVAPHR